MKFGLSLGQVNPKSWAAVAQAGDRLGFESVWFPEHLVFPVVMAGSPNAGEEHPPVPPHVPVFDIWVYAAYLAAQTERIRFGSYVFNIGLRHPFVTARSIATADVLSGGRIDFGVGASWLAEEWAATGLDFRTRGRRVDEALEICQRLWTERVVAHDGESFSFAEVMFEPKPVQPHIPIHIGGDTPAALRRTARFGDGWMPLSTPLADVPAARERITALMVEAGTVRPLEVTVAAELGSPADLAAYEAAGVDRLLVHPWTSSRAAVEGVEQFAVAYL